MNRHQQAYESIKKYDIPNPEPKRAGSTVKKFAFIIHPRDAGEITSKYKIARYLPRRVVESIIRLTPPFKAAWLTGLRSPYGQAEGWLITVPLTAGQMLGLPDSFVAGRIIQAGKLAEELGAGIIGLGGCIPVVKNAGAAAGWNLQAAVTTGDSCHMAFALEGLGKAAQLMGYNLNTARVVVLGAAEPAGSMFTCRAAGLVKKMTLVAEEKRALEEIAAKILFESGLSVKIASDVKESLQSAQVVVLASAAAGTSLLRQVLPPGAVLYDWAGSGAGRQVVEFRDDVLLIEGTVVKVPGGLMVDAGYGLPPGMICPRMAETIMLAMEERCDGHSPGGRAADSRKVEEMAALAKKHGFTLSGFKSFKGFVSFSDVENIKSKVNKKRVRAI